MVIEFGGLLGLIVFILDIVAIVKVVQSNESAGIKILWFLIIMMLPLIGLILWWLMGPKPAGG